MYCHRCKASEYIPLSTHSLAEIAAARREAEAKLSGKVEFPADAVDTDWPLEANVWVLQGGLRVDAAVAQGFKYSPSVGKLLMPVFDERGTTQAILARALDGSKPKYRMLGGSAGMHFPRGMPTSDTMCVTEDILSALACVRAGYRAAAVLGTSLSAIDAVRIMRLGVEQVFVLMDPDKPGVIGATKVRKSLAVCPIPVRIVKVRLDPKYLPRSEIRAVIEDARKEKDA